VETPLRHAAHARAGDKGDISSIVVIAYSETLYPVIEQQVTAETVAERLTGIITGDVVRYEIPHLWVLNFVARGALGGGVSRSLRIDNYGKSLASAVLGLTVDVPDALIGELRGLDHRDTDAVFGRI
jgi:hypothetical protein